MVFCTSLLLTLLLSPELAPAAWGLRVIGVHRNNPSLKGGSLNYQVN